MPVSIARSPLLLLALLVACAQERLPGPQLEAVEPAHGYTALDVPVTLRGRAFYIAARQTLRGEDPIRVDDNFGAWLEGPDNNAGVVVQLRDVEFVDSTTLRAVVPAGSAVGGYTVVLRTPLGRDALRDGYEVLPGAGPGDAGALDGVAPDAAIPDAISADTAAPDTASSDTSVGDSAAADATRPDAAAPDATAPDATAPDATAPDAGGVLPSDSIDPQWIADATAIGDLRGNVRIDTDQGTVDGVSHGHFHVVQAQDCGGWPVEIGVFAFKQLRIRPDAVVRVVGHRALALVAPEEISIEGLIDVTGGREACVDPLMPPYDPGAGPPIEDPGNWCAGPGGYRGGSSGNPGEQGEGPGGGGSGTGGQAAGFLDESGGGGGGKGGTGGAGGDAIATGGADPLVNGGSGGAAWLGAPTLCGGSGGGGGGAGTNWDPSQHPGAAGGGGGGAVHIFAGQSISIQRIGAGINAGGAGGAGDLFSEFDDGGGGGGAGGIILLESPTITIGQQAVLAANGGGGGGRATGSPGDQGEAGQLGVAPAQPGVGGGQGGAGPLIDGQNGIDADDGAGGGGGAAGQIFIWTEGGNGLTAIGIVSPAPVEGAL